MLLQASIVIKQFNLLNVYFLRFLHLICQKLFIIVFNSLKISLLIQHAFTLHITAFHLIKTGVMHEVYLELPKRSHPVLFMSHSHCLLTLQPHHGIPQTSIKLLTLVYPITKIYVSTPLFTIIINSTMIYDPTSTYKNWFLAWKTLFFTFYTSKYICYNLIALKSLSK